MSNSTHHHRFGIFSRGENEVLKLILTNLDFSVETARGLVKLVDSLKNHDEQTALNVAKSIGEMESRADSMHQEAVEKISSGSFFGGVREDLLGLLEDIDNIADAAKDSSRVFSQRNIPFDVTDYLFKRDVRSFIDKLIETDEALKVAVLALGEKDVKTKVVDLATKVERKEEEADEIRASILDNLLKNEIRADPLDIIMLKEFLEIADDVADGAEDASDVLLVLIAKGYT